MPPVDDFWRYMSGGSPPGGGADSELPGYDPGAMTGNGNPFGGGYATGSGLNPFNRNNPYQSFLRRGTTTGAEVGARLQNPSQTGTPGASGGASPSRYALTPELAARQAEQRAMREASEAKINDWRQGVLDRQRRETTMSFDPATGRMTRGTRQLGNTSYNPDGGDFASGYRNGPARYSGGYSMNADYADAINTGARGGGSTGYTDATGKRYAMDKFGQFESQSPSMARSRTPSGGTATPGNAGGAQIDPRILEMRRGGRINPGLSSSGRPMARPSYNRPSSFQGGFSRPGGSQSGYGMNRMPTNGGGYQMPRRGY